MKSMLPSLFLAVLALPGGALADTAARASLVVPDYTYTAFGRASSQ